MVNNAADDDGIDRHGAHDCNTDPKTSFFKENDDGIDAWRDKRHHQQTHHELKISVHVAEMLQLCCTDFSADHGLDENLNALFRKAHEFAEQWSGDLLQHL